MPRSAARPGGHRPEARHRPAGLFARGGGGGIEKLGWYARRRRIALSHKVLKSGCRAEEARLRTAERLVNLLALFCILSWRLFWLTMVNRAAPDASPRLASTGGEVRLLDRMANRPSNRSPPPTLSSYLTQIARLGGNLARASDPPPDTTVMWRGWSRLTDIKRAVALADAAYGQSQEDDAGHFRGLDACYLPPCCMYNTGMEISARITAFQ